MHALIGAGEIDGVMLMSPRTAKIYADLMNTENLAEQASAMRHYCLSEGVLNRLRPLGSVPTHVASHPREEDLLALLDAGPAQ